MPQRRRHLPVLWRQAVQATVEDRMRICVIELFEVKYCPAVRQSQSPGSPPGGGGEREVEVAIEFNEWLCDLCSTQHPTPCFVYWIKKGDEGKKRSALVIHALFWRIFVI